MTQIAADAFSLPVNQVSVKLGDSAFLKGVNSGGSQVSASVGPAIRAAAMGAISKLTEMAVANSSSPLHSANAEEIIADNGRSHLINKPDVGEAYAQILNREGKPNIEALAKTNVSTCSSAEPAPSPPGSPEGMAEAESKMKNAVQQDQQIDRKHHAFT